jgi:hypothetical protein
MMRPEPITIGSVKKAWQTAVLKAHSHTPLWITGKHNQLAPESLDLPDAAEVVKH